jgi:Na+-translocating ferredoxin:NAD+ oxidoreductase RnfD subunit
MSVTTLTMSSRSGSAATSPFKQAVRWLRTPKAWLFAIFVPLLVLAAPVAGWPATLHHVVLAVAGACVAEIAALEARHRPWRFPSSALLSGLIVAFVLGPETPSLVTLVLGALATVSKHLLVTRRGHVFNPAALALLVAVPLFATDQSWWGALPDLAWPWTLLLLLGGIVLVDRLNKLPLLIAFLGVYFGLFTAVAFADPVRVSEMFRPPFVQAALFLAFFMLTDPPTSPSRYADQVWIGALVALVSCLAQLLGAGQSYLLIGLLAGNVALAVRRRVGAALAARPAAREVDGSSRTMGGTTTAR